LQIRLRKEKHSTQKENPPTGISRKQDNGVSVKKEKMSYCKMSYSLMPYDFKKGGNRVSPTPPLPPQAWTKKDVAISSFFFARMCKKLGSKKAQKIMKIANISVSWLDGRVRVGIGQLFGCDRDSRSLAAA